MRQVPTAEEFLTEKGYSGFAKHTLIKEWMKEFAKLHVEAALEAAQESTLEYDFTEEITNSYPLEDIK